MVARRLKFRNVQLSAFALALACPCWAQPAPSGEQLRGEQGLTSKLDEAEKTLDSDIEACRPIDVADYEALSRENARDMQLALDAYSAGAPIDFKKINSDYHRSQDLLKKAKAAAAEQKAKCPPKEQPKTETAPKDLPRPAERVNPATLPAASKQPTADRPGLSPGIEQSIAHQQRTIGEFEEDLDRLQALIKAGKCDQAWYLVDDLDEWLDELDGYVPWDSLWGPRPEIPGRLIDEWDDRIGEVIKGCPRPGRPTLDLALVAEMHNKARAAYNYQPLRISLKLSEHAQEPADRIAQTGVAEHSSRAGRGLERENISQGLPWWSVSQLLESWTKEKTKFKPGVFPDVSITHNWYDVGHWAQMIWAQTVMVGCAKAIGGAVSVLVCRYWPGGNKDGKPVGYPAHPVEPPPLEWGGSKGAATGLDKPALPAAAVVSPNPPAPTYDWEVANEGFLDFGDESGLSGFVGGGVGVARVDYNNVRAFANQAAVTGNSDSDFIRSVLLGVPCAPGAQPGTEVDILVDQPELPPELDPLAPLLTPEQSFQCIM